MKKQQPKIKRRKRYTAEQREKARKYYLRGLYLPEINKLMDIPIRTLEKWQRLEKWTLLKETPEIKKRAFELSQGGYSYKKIAELLQISTVTVWRYCKEVKNQRDEN